MISFQEMSCGKAWIHYLKITLESSVPIFDGKIKLHETSIITINIIKFIEPDPIIEQHGDIELIDLYRRKCEETKIIEPFSVSYGQRIQVEGGRNGVEWISNVLRKKPESKSAIISLLSPQDELGKVPCLCCIQAKIRNGYLSLTAFFRSQNVFRSYANFIALHGIQSKICSYTKTPIGSLAIVVNCPHIYHTDIEAAKKIVQEHS